MPGLSQPTRVESAISTSKSAELLSQLHPALLTLAEKAGVVPLAVVTSSGRLRGASQMAFLKDLGDQVGEEVLWLGHYPGFCADKALKFQVALSEDADATRWGVSDEDALWFLCTGTVRNGVAVARKGKDLKALRG